MTTYWCYFSWMIANNFVSVYCILTKLGTKMRPYTTFMCTKFQGNQTIHFRFMVTFIWRQKEGKKNKKKNEETKPVFESLYLRNAWRDLVEIWNARYWQWRASAQQRSSGFVKAARSYIYAKITLLFFLLIYSRVWRTGFLGRKTHYRVSWLHLISVAI